MAIAEAPRSSTVANTVSKETLPSLRITESIAMEIVTEQLPWTIVEFVREEIP
jgi:hypothetical protein